MIEVSISDIDFYERKIKTLEEDNVYLHDEIMKLRARLRTAEDYEIKYSLLVSANQKEMDRLKNHLEKQQEGKRQEFLSNKLKQSDAKWRNQFNDFEVNLRKSVEFELETLKKELAERNQTLQNLKQKSEEIEFFTFKMNKIEKENQNLKEEIEQMKQFYETQRAEEISKLRTTLNATYREKIENQKNKYELKIIDLENRLNHLQIQDDNVNFKVSDATNRELTTLKQLFDQKSKEYSKQLQETRNLLNSKNNEIKRILEQHSNYQQKHRQEIRQQKNYCKDLEDKILQREKQHQIELLNLVDRLNAAKDEENQELNDQIQRLNEEISRSHELWNERILNHENQIDELNRKFEEERRRLIEDKNMHKRKFSELSMKVKQAEGEREMGETQMLINSLRDMDAKEDHIGAYENGITFLQRQYKKVQVKLEQKSRAASKFYKQINDIRAEADKQLSEMKERMKKDKKQNTQRILALQEQLREATDKLKSKEKQERKRDRELQKDSKELQEQVKSLKEQNQELLRDYNRVIEDRKGVEASYRQERQKSFASRTDLNLVKKQKWLQLERQKNELHVIFKEKEEQLKLSFEQQLDQLTNQLNRLKQDHEICQKQNQLLKRDNEKFMQQLQINKQNSKMSDYNKKIASLNLQIALTQDLYENLVKAKSRINVSNSQAESEVHLDLNQGQQNQQSLLVSFHPSMPLNR